MGRRQRRGLVAAGLSLALLVPSGAAVATPSEAGVAQRAHDRREHRQFDHPTVTIDRVYAGAVDGVVGTHEWTGDVFGTGVTTTVTYVVELGIDGIPVLTSVTVDESTLPEGATYSVREGTVATRTDEDHDHDDMAKSEDDTDDASGDDTATMMEVSTDDGSADDEVADSEVEAVTTWFSGRAGVRFSMGDRWAGLLILLNGKVGDESVAHLKTILVSPPANGRDDGTDETDTDDEMEEETTRPDRHDDASRDGSKSRAEDRPEKRDRDRADRNDDDRGQSNDRRSDDRSNGSSGRRGNG